MDTVTFTFKYPEIDSLNRMVTATMPLRHVKLIAAILGPMCIQDYIEALCQKNANKEAEYVQVNGEIIYELYSPIPELLKSVGQAF